MYITIPNHRLTGSTRLLWWRRADSMLQAPRGSVGGTMVVNAGKWKASSGRWGSSCVLAEFTE